MHPASHEFTQSEQFSYCRSAGCPTCCIADCQSAERRQRRTRPNFAAPAALATRDTADWQLKPKPQSMELVRGLRRALRRLCGTPHNYHVRITSDTLSKI